MMFQSFRTTLSQVPFLLTVVKLNLQVVCHRHLSKTSIYYDFPYNRARWLQASGPRIAPELNTTSVACLLRCVLVVFTLRSKLIISQDFWPNSLSMISLCLYFGAITQPPAASNSFQISQHLDFKSTVKDTFKSQQK